MEPLLIATKNQAKIAEFSSWLSKNGILFKTLNEFPDVFDVEETGTTFEENAKLKAREYFEATGLPTLADDGGFEIDALGGKPGVYSKRWVHGGLKEATDEEIVAHTISEMKGIPKEKRGARIRSILALYDGKEFILADASIEGIVADVSSHYESGFPYRGLLYVTKYGKMYDELSEEEHHASNQRMLGLEKLRTVIEAKFKN